MGVRDGHFRTDGFSRDMQRVYLSFKCAFIVPFNQQQTYLVAGLSLARYTPGFDYYDSSGLVPN